MRRHIGSHHRQQQERMRWLTVRRRLGVVVARVAHRLDRRGEAGEPEEAGDPRVDAFDACADGTELVDCKEGEREGAKEMRELRQTKYVPLA